MNIDAIEQETSWVTGAALMLLCSAVLSTLIVYGSTWMGGIADAL